jgi:small subunit ribosomal protein S1
MDVEGYLRASELSRDRVEDARTLLKDGDEVEAVIIAVDRKSRNISLSIKAKDAQEDSTAMKNLSVDSASAGTTNLGALLKAKLSGSNE